MNCSIKTANAAFCSTNIRCAYCYVLVQYSTWRTSAVHQSSIISFLKAAKSTDEYNNKMLNIRTSASRSKQVAAIFILILIEYEERVCTVLPADMFLAIESCASCTRFSFSARYIRWPFIKTTSVGK